MEEMPNLAIISSFGRSTLKILSAIKISEILNTATAASPQMIFLNIVQNADGSQYYRDLLSFRGIFEGSPSCCPYISIQRRGSRDSFITDVQTRAGEMAESLFPATRLQRHSVHIHHFPFLSFLGEARFIELLGSKRPRFTLWILNRYLPQPVPSPSWIIYQTR